MLIGAMSNRGAGRVPRTPYPTLIVGGAEEEVWAVTCYWRGGWAVSRSSAGPP
jgi:hypothetical protein